MDDVTICDMRARDIRTWQINSQNFRVRKILGFLRYGYNVTFHQVNHILLIGSIIIISQVLQNFHTVPNAVSGLYYAINCLSFFLLTGKLPVTDHVRSQKLVKQQVVQQLPQTAQYSLWTTNL